MRCVPLLPTDGPSFAPVSELGFGCAAIAGRVSLKESLVGLNAAYEAGVTLYDTARSYGYGQSERVVGEFLRGRRQSVVLCTKFGILPSSNRGWKQKLKPLARTALKLFPGMRKAVQRQVGDQFVPGQFTVDVLQHSFDTSLSELKTDYVDMLLLHAAPATTLEQDDLMAALERLVESGKVRMAGFSGDHSATSAFFAKRPPVLKTAQFALNLATMDFTRQTRVNGDLLLVANHPFGGPAGAAAGKAAIESLRAKEAISAELKAKLDPSDPQVLPEIVLNCILRGTGVSSVIPAMMKPSHIRSNIRSVENCRFTVAELALIRESLMS